MKFDLKFQCQKAKIKGLSHRRKIGFIRKVLGATGRQSVSQRKQERLFFSPHKSMWFSQPSLR